MPEIHDVPVPGGDEGAVRADRKAVRRQISALREALRIVGDLEPLEERDSLVLDERIRRLVVAQLEYDEHFGRIAAPFFRERLWRHLGFSSQDAYAREPSPPAPGHAGREEAPVELPRGGAGCRRVLSGSGCGWSGGCVHCPSSGRLSGRGG
jgi:hypothetical protein